jgi:hypothetical protein
MDPDGMTSSGDGLGALDVIAFVQPDAWEQARNQYVEDLTLVERDLFANASLENILHDARNAQKSHDHASISRGVVAKLKPLIEGIAQYGSALDVFSNASSTILCPLWGSIRVLLYVSTLFQNVVEATLTQRQLAIEFNKYFERLVEMFHQISDILPVFRTYEKLFSKHPRLIKAISEVYLDIFRFCAAAKAVFRKGAKSPFLTTVGIGLKLTWRPFEQQYGEVLDKFQRNQIKVEREIDLARTIENTNHQEITKEMQQKLEAMEEMRIEQAAAGREIKWFNALRTSDYEFTKDKNPERVPGTCEWLLKHNKYKAWLDSKRAGMILVSADPGCGKSVLSRFVVDNPDLADFESTGALCYFFFKDDSDEDRSAYHALSAILHQLFCQKRYLLRTYSDLYVDRGRPSFDDLWKILIASSTDPKLSSITCVVDGLDECTEETRGPLIQRLAKLCAHPPEAAKIKFMITSRPYNHIKMTFRKNGFDVQLVQVMGENSIEREEISSEIGLVVAEKIERFHETRLWNGVEDNAHEILAERLAQIVNRTYLWVALVFPELEMYAGASERELVAVLDTLPKTIVEAYEKILDRSLNREKARKLLHIVTAAMRPLSLDELNLAMALEEGARSEADVYLTPTQSFPMLIRIYAGYSST